MVMLATGASVFALQENWVPCNVYFHGPRVRSNLHFHDSRAFRPARIAPVIRNGASFICKGSDKGNNDGEPSSDEGQGSSSRNGSDDHEMNKNVDRRLSSSSDSNVQNMIENWRTFRARLVAGEQSDSQTMLSGGEKRDQAPLQKKWAHAIHAPESGCLLVATKKLDDYYPFKRSVILLLRSGSNKHQDGPFGVILNKPILQMTSGSEPITEAMARVFQNRHLYFGGPLPADIFVMMPKVEGKHPFEEIMPGVYYGYYTDNLKLAPELSKDHNILDDFRFFMGYAGWDFDQLENEIAEGFWVVAACSADLIREASSDFLWQEVLMSMGGEYEELVKKLEDGT